jgi:hypothetical protein
MSQKNGARYINTQSAVQSGSNVIRKSGRGGTLRTWFSRSINDRGFTIGENMTKSKIIALVTGVFAGAAAVGSTLLSPEQRESILAALPALLAIIGL